MDEKYIKLNWLWVHKWKFNEFHFLCSIIKWYKNNKESYEYTFEVSVFKDHDKLLKEVRELNHRCLWHISQEEFEEGYRVAKNDEIEYEMNELRYAYPKVINTYSLEQLIDVKIENLKLKIWNDIKGVKINNIISKVLLEEEFEKDFWITLNFILEKDLKNNIFLTPIKWKYKSEGYYNILKNKYKNYWLKDSRLELFFYEIVQEYSIDVSDQETFILELSLSWNIEVISFSQNSITILIKDFPLVSINDSKKLSFNNGVIRYEGKEIIAFKNDDKKIIGELRSQKENSNYYVDIINASWMKPITSDAFRKRVERINDKIFDLIWKGFIEIRKVRKDYYKLDINLDNT